MDEAFSTLDPSTRSDMQKLIRKIWKETGTTILFVTHNIAEAIYLSSRVVVLGCPPGGEGSSVALDLPIPESCRSANGFPREDELRRMIRMVEEASVGTRIEVEMAEFGG
jgi:ABC-type nitrate/sulfonate/bicarbonate transport system ATPase subunit